MNTDALDTGLIFGAIAAFNHGGPVAGCAFSIAAASIAVMRRSPSLQAALLDDEEPRLLNAPARYFFQPAPPAQLPAPKAPKRKRIAAQVEDEPRTLITPEFDNAALALPDGSERAEIREVVAEVKRRIEQPVQARTALVTKQPEQPKSKRGRAIIDDSGISIEIGTLRTGEPMRVLIKHGIVSVATGGGKTNILDYISAQLVELDRLGQCELWVASPKYVAVTKDRIERYRLFTGLPAHRKEFRGEAIVDWIERAAEMMQYNYDRANEPPYIWPERPMVLILDEIKALLEVSDAETEGRIMKALKTILLKGREIECYIIFASQDGYCGSLKLTVGEIQNLGFRAIHPALDANSLKNLLPPDYRMPKRASFQPHEWLIARGNDVSIVSIPRVDNAMLRAYGLFEDETRAIKTQPVRNEPKPVMAHDPFETWVNELMSQGPSHEPKQLEVSHADETIQAIQSAVSRGHLERRLILALADGDETKAIIGLHAAGLKATPIAKLLGGRMQATLERVRAVLDIEEAPEMREIQEVEA